MGAPLNDITIYYSGTKIKDAPDDLEFRFIANHVTDSYFHKLNGYKPPKTGRICFHLFASDEWDNTGYFGSICHCCGVIDEDKYLNLSKQDKHKYLLDLLHNTILELAEIYVWDKDVFNNAYDEVVRNGFDFSKIYPEKKSKDRKKSGQAVVKKIYDRSYLCVRIQIDGIVAEFTLLEKKNYGIYDRLYWLAKDCKWIDGHSFGFSNASGECFYSLLEKKAVAKVIFDLNGL